MNSREYEERFFETKEVNNIEKGSVYKHDSFRIEQWIGENLVPENDNNKIIK